MPTTTEKRCEYSSCGKRLHRRQNEKLYNFRKRTTCDKTCSALHAGEKGRKSKGQLIASEKIAPASVNGLMHLEPDHNPDMCHSIPASRTRYSIDVFKSEEEVDRMWAYLKMMGRC